MVVSILVLMEDVKELMFFYFPTLKWGSFNPCFNGRCKRTNTDEKKINKINVVSILVLMEDVKEPI